MDMVRRSALVGVFLVAVLVSAAASAAPASAITDKGLPRGAGMRLLDPGQRISHLAEDITNGPKVTVKWWVPSRAYTRVKFTFSPFGAARTVAVGRSLGGSFKTDVVAPSTAKAGGKGFVVPPQGWYRFKVTMTLYKGRSTAGRRTLRMYVDLQKPTLQGIDLVTTIDPYNLDDLSLDEWDPLQVQFDDNLPPSVERPGQTHVQLSGVFYLATSAIVGGGPAGDGLNGKLLGGVVCGLATGRPRHISLRNRRTDRLLHPARQGRLRCVPAGHLRAEAGLRRRRRESIHRDAGLHRAAGSRTGSRRADRVEAAAPRPAPVLTCATWKRSSSQATRGCRRMSRTRRSTSVSAWWSSSTTPAGCCAPAPA